MPKGGRRRRDPNKPKRGKSAFLLFSQYTRPAVIEEHPSMTFAELAKEVRSNHISKCKFDLDCALSLTSWPTSSYLQQVARRWKIIDPDEKAVSSLGLHCL